MRWPDIDRRHLPLDDPRRWNPWTPRAHRDPVFHMERREKDVTQMHHEIDSWELSKELRCYVYGVRTPVFLVMAWFRAKAWLTSLRKVAQRL